MASKNSKLIESHREGAEIYHGAAICKQKAEEMLGHFHLPKAIMPLNNLVEVGYNQTTGFIWLKQQKGLEHCYKAINKSTKYEQVITGFIEDRGIKNLAGVKAKDMVWVTISYISVHDDDSKCPKITFGTPIGLSRSYPAAFFEAEE